MKRKLFRVKLALALVLINYGFSYSQNLAVLAITYPVAGNCAVNANQDSITVQVRNLGASTVNSYDISYNINNGPIVTETSTAAITAGATVTYKFNSYFNRSTGVNDIKVFTSLPGDIARTNDTAKVRLVTKINSFPYYENFEVNDGGFSANGNNSSWGWGSPNKVKMKPGEGVRSWYNGFPNGNYLSSDASFLTFPCYDFTNLKNPLISFKFFLEVENTWESVVLEYSTNGTNFQILGGAGEPNGCNTQNWYNNGATWTGNTDNRGGSWGFGCTNNICGKWVVSKHCIDFLKGQPNVYFRFRFASTGTQQEAEGVGVDSIFIGDPPAPPFNFSAPSACANAPVTFTPTLHPCITSNRWDFGDGSPILTVANAVHVYKNPGTYKAQLIVTSYCNKQDTLTKNVIVLPPPPVVRDSTVLKSRYCISDAPITLAGSRIPAGGTFYINGTIATSFNPNTLGIGNHTVVYIYTEPSGNRCTSRDTQLVRVYIPTVSIDSLGGSYCLSSPAVQLKGTPAGGIFTVDGNPATSFSAAALGLGMHIITYTYSDPDGCIGSDSRSIEVVSNIVAQINGLSSSYCSYEPPISLSGTPLGGTFTVDGTPTFVLNPSLLDTGMHRIIYSYSDGGSCGDKDTFDINIVRIIATIDNLDSVYCYNAPLVGLSGNPLGGNFFVDGNPAFSFNPAALSVATHKILYVYTDPVSLCIDSVSQIIRIDKPVLAFIDINDSYCKNSPNVILKASPVGGSFKLNGNTVTEINPTLLDTGFYTLVYSYTNPATGCTNTRSKTIYIAPLPVPYFIGLDSTFCVTSDLVDLHAAPLGGAFTINNLPVQILDPSVLDLNIPHVVAYQYVEQNFGCVASVKQNIKVVAPPSVSISGIKGTYCLSDPAFTPTGNPSGGKFIINDVDTVAIIDPALLGNGTHKITYYFNAADGCDATIKQQITVLPAVTGNILPNPVSVCPGEKVELTFNGNGNIIWNTGQTNKTIAFTPTATAHYWVKATDCANFYDSVLVTLKTAPKASFSLSGNEGLIPFSVIATAHNISTPNILWMMDTLKIPEVNPLEYRINKAGQLTITLVVDSLGCTDTLTQLVNAIEQVIPVKLPNVFTPDNDGINDDFGINPDAQRFVKQCSFQVFNRWGSLLFETSDPYQRWDGTDKGSNAPDGVYFYVLNASLSDNSPVKLTGSVQIIRGNQ
jgi:gliding motility-associated-like protein